MKVISMTGFASCDLASQTHEVNWEIKSVNNRFRDFRFRLPQFLNHKEIEIRKKIERKFFRGSFDISCQVKSLKTKDYKFNIDYEKVNLYLKEFKENVAEEIFSFSPLDFLRKDFLLEASDKSKSHLVQFTLSGVDELLDSLALCRQEEGEELKKVLLSFLETCENSYQKIKDLSQEFQIQREKKLKKKFEESTLDLKSESDKERFQKELIYYLEKLNIDEELDRAMIHFKKMRNLLSSSDKRQAVGRELEFMLQEMNRETNTIGSKSANDLISEEVIKVKIALEKMREQALNIE